MDQERPILFSSEMVRAILEGRKTQTRRVVQFPRHWKNIDLSQVMAEIDTYVGK
jgi:hypothetical protein